MSYNNVHRAKVWRENRRQYASCMFGRILYSSSLISKTALFHLLHCRYHIRPLSLCLTMVDDDEINTSGWIMCAMDTAPCSMISDYVYDCSCRLVFTLANSSSIDGANIYISMKSWHKTLENCCLYDIKNGRGKLESGVVVIAYRTFGGVYIDYQKPGTSSDIMRLWRIRNCRQRKRPGSMIRGGG